MRKILILAAGAALMLTSCSALKHKEKDKSKSQVDSTSHVQQESTFQDTGRVRTYERFSFMMPPSVKLTESYTPFDPKLPVQAEALGNVGSSLQDFRSLLDLLKKGTVPMYYERTTDEKKGASGTNKSDAKTEVEKKDSQVQVDTKSNNIPIYIILGVIVLILIFKKK